MCASANCCSKKPVVATGSSQTHTIGPNRLGASGFGEPQQVPRGGWLWGHARRVFEDFRMRGSLAFTAAGVMAGLLAIVSGTAAAEEPIVLKDMGSFHVGGRVVEVSGQQVREVRASANGVPAKVDPNGRYVVEQMYVQYFIPQTERGRVPLLLWHGGGLSGVTYETTPDGRPGWLNDFLRKGWAVYNSDAVERGRSGWPAIEPEVFTGEAMLATAADAFGRFRIGAGANSWSADPVQRKTLPG